MGRPVIRAESVGSLLRPPALRQLFEQVYAGHLTPGQSLLSDAARARLEELNRLADDAIADAIARQIDIGLDVITDGEMRRPMFTHSVVDALAGYDDNPHEIDYGNDGLEPLPPPTDPLIGRERLQKVDNPALRELEHIRSLTDYPFKLTFPAGSYWYYEPAELREGVYETQDEFVAHVVELEREVIAEVVAAGALHIQLDWPLYPALVDPRRAPEQAAQIGETPESLLEKALAADAALLDSIPAGVTKAMHICRGNYRSRWLMQGSLEPVAEHLFALPCDRFLVEWEDIERQGDYSALRFVPAGGPVVAMGIVSTKSTEVESDDELERRLHEAAAHVPLEQLALSPQCGFASTWEGNELAEEIQWRKLEAVGRVADRVWGQP
jgi:5-methyltetrahydropteroyltriglutamate--homocysteine methyltransferase